MPLNPILRIIRYLFKRRNISNTDKTIKSFFGNGISFPQFVALAFNIDAIPNIDPKPTTASQRINNNTLAYQHLKNDYSKASIIVPDLSDSEKSQADLLSFILTQKFFKINPERILRKCNKIVQYHNIFYNSINDLIEQNCLLTLLSILTHKKVQYRYKTKNIDKLLKQNFKDAEVPLVIDSTSFEEQNQFLFLIQIQIMLDIFSEEIKKEHYFSSDFSDDYSSSENLDENTKNDNDMLPKKQIKISENFSEINDSKDSFISLQDSRDSLSNITDSNDSFISLQDSRDYLSSITDSKDSILSTSSDFLSSHKSRKNRKKKKSSFLFDLNEKLLLDVINAICGESYDYFEQTIKEENFVKIMMQIFEKNERIKTDIIQILKNNENTDISKIDLIVEYLSEIESKFKILVLDFQNPEFADSSAVLLFTNILNFFFLKSPKQELFERCYTILHYCDYEDPNEKYREYSTLSKLKTYKKLLEFVLKRGKTEENSEVNNLMLNNDKNSNKLNNSILKNEIDDSMLKNDKIPIVINDEFLNEYVKKYDISSIVYFQLQFMFNYLDEKAKHLHVIEYFLIAIRKIKLIKVPLTNKLAKSIRTKYLSLILQMKRSESHSQKEKKIENDTNSDNSEIADNYETEMMPKTFRERRIEHSIKIQKKRGTLNLIQLVTEEQYWNHDDHQVYAFHNGILFRKQKNYKVQPLIGKNKVHYQSLRPQKSSSIEDDYSNEKIYKFFYYNEDSNKWVFNESEFDQFKKDKNIDPEESKLPLILFFSSKENNSFEVCSKLIRCKINEIKDDQISVYAICDKNDSAPKCSIYLILHVPKEKEKIPKIGRIVIQIYLFLFFIQNAIVIILNDMRELQFQFQKEILSISNSFKFQNESKKSKKNDDLNKDNDENIEEEEEEEEAEDEIDNNDFYEGDEKIDLLNQINPQLFNKPINYIYIINEAENDEPKKDIVKNVTNKLTKKFYPKLDSKSISFKINFINITDPNTYGAVFTSLNDYTINCNKNYYNLNEIEKNFRFLSLFELSDTYIQIKNDKSFSESNLNQLVNGRYQMLRKNIIDTEINDFTILANLQKEMLSTFPLLDSNYFVKCNLILSELKKKISQENNKIIDSELRISSLNSIKYLDEVIKNGTYWTNEQSVSIIDGHINFLKEEFFNIIHDLFSQKIFIIIYAENMHILNKIIIDDTNVIKSMFDEFNEKLEKNNIEQKKLQKGANTTIRERKNERDTSVRLSNNEVLEELIEQDF